MSKPVLYGSVHTLSLPSGAKVHARRPSVLSLIVSGGFPAELTMEVWKIANKDLSAEKALETPDSLKSWAALLDAFIPHVLVSPKAGDVTDLREDETTGVLQGTVSMIDMPDLDKQVVFLFGNGAFASDEEIVARKEKEAVAGKAMATFREGTERVDAGHDSETVRSETEQPSSPA